MCLGVVYLRKKEKWKEGIYILIVLQGEFLVVITKKEEYHLDDYILELGNKAVIDHLIKATSR